MANHTELSNVSLVEKTSGCRQDIPLASEVLTGLPEWAKGLIALYTICCVISVVVFVEEIIFLVRRFNRGDRLNATAWILSIYPIFTLTSFLALLVPRSGTLINLVANTFFATSIYQLVGLMVNYLGGTNKMWSVLDENRDVSLRTLPVCCCCFCLPVIKLSKGNFFKIHALVMQLTIVRPVVLFIAAVLWTNNHYIPGNLLPNNAFLYIAIVNLTSTMLAMWGLLILKGAFNIELGERYKMPGKIASVQLLLVSTAVVNIITGLLVTTGAVKCTSLLNSRARADALYHQVLCVLACLFGLMARFFYRREEDANENYSSIENLPTSPNDIKDIHL